MLQGKLREESPNLPRRPFALLRVTTAWATPVLFIVLGHDVFTSFLRVLSVLRALVVYYLARDLRVFIPARGDLPGFSEYC